MENWTANIRHGITGKEEKNKKNVQKSCLERAQNQKVSIGSRIKAIQIMGQNKGFCMQRIPESGCVGKRTVDIDILKQTVDIDILITSGMVTENLC